MPYYNFFLSKIIASNFLTSSLEFASNIFVLKTMNTW